MIHSAFATISGCRRSNEIIPLGANAFAGERMLPGLPKFRIADYTEMLATLGWLFLVVNFCILFFLRSSIPKFDLFLNNIDNYIPKVIPPSISALSSVLVIAIFVSIVSHAVRLHDKISDIFRIRIDFDVYKILLPLALLSGATVRSNEIDRVWSQRNDLMQKVFYKYASSAKKETLVDKHDIISALTNWLWFWFFLESIIQFAIAAIVLYFFSSVERALILFSAIVPMLIVGRFIYRSASKYAMHQIKQIVENESACKEVKAAFDAL
jgi:hypothetical protein